MDMAENPILVKLDIKQEKVKVEFEEIVSSTDGFQIEKNSTPPSFDLLILEIGEDLKKEFQLITNIQDSGMAREIFLTSSRFDPDLLIQAIRAGAKEFFPQPIKKEEVRLALSKFRDRREKVGIGREKRKKGKIIDVIGSKGGVGNTTIAVNLAASLIESGGSPLVALIDMNLLFGEHRICFQLGRNCKKHLQGGFNLFDEYPFQAFFRCLCPPFSYRIGWGQCGQSGDYRKASGFDEECIRLHCDRWRPGPG